MTQDQMPAGYQIIFFSIRAYKDYYEKTSKKTGKAQASAQKVTNTLFGYLPGHEKEKAFFSHSNTTKQWEFKEDNYNYMIENFSDDYNLTTQIDSEIDIQTDQSIKQRIRIEPGGPG